MSEATAGMIVIGGGIAGLAAAARAVELGLRPVVLEQGARPDYRCNSRSSGGIFHVAYHDMKADPALLAAAIHKTSADAASDGLVAAIAGNAGRLIDWLSAHGIRFMKASPVDWHRWTVAPPRPLRSGLDFPGLGVDTILTRLTAVITERGGAIRLGHHAQAIERTEDGLLRVTCATEVGSVALSARAVVIADGGFQADPELMRAHISPRPEHLVQRGAATGRGDGIRMARALGAALTRADRFYGHLLHRNALANDALWPYPTLDAIAAAALVVGPDGRRFVDEGRGGVYLSNVIAALPDPAAAFVIFDQAIWDDVGRQTLYPANPVLETLGGAIIRAETLPALAAAAGLDADALAAEVAAHNAAIGDGIADARPVPRTGRPSRISGGPFMAVPLCPGITHTMGGLAVDGRMRVLDQAGHPIPGLYAAGGSTGGLEGGDAVGYVGGLVKGGVMGLLAAEDIAGASRRDAAPPAPAPRPAPAYPFLRLAMRHGASASLVASFLVAALAAALAWPAGPWLALAAAAALGIGTYLLLRILMELVALVTAMLLPHDP